MFTSAHLLICLSLRLKIFPTTLTCSLRICWSANLLRLISSLTSSHLHILLILISVYLDIWLSSHLLLHLLSPVLIFTSTHLQIFSHIFSHIGSASHLLIFTSSVSSAHLGCSLHLLNFRPSLICSHLARKRRMLEWYENSFFYNFMVLLNGPV